MMKYKITSIIGILATVIYFIYGSKVLRMPCHARGFGCVAVPIMAYSFILVGFITLVFALGALAEKNWGKIGVNILMLPSVFFLLVMLFNH